MEQKCAQQLSEKIDEKMYNYYWEGTTQDPYGEEIDKQPL